MPRRLSSFDRGLQHGQRLQAEEVELHQPRLLDPFHVELGHRQVGFRIAIDRHQFGERPVADHDAGRMGRGVAVQAFELHRDVEGAPHHRLGVARRLQARLLVDRARERHRRGRIHRHQLAQLVDLPVRHLQHAADVAQHAARLQRAEGDDLRRPDRARSAPARSRITSSRRSWQKSMSKSGIDTRSGLRKRSNRSPKRIGSRSVMVSA